MTLNPLSRGAFVPACHSEEQDPVCRDEDRLTASFFGIARNLSHQVWQCILPPALLEGRVIRPETVRLWPRYPEAPLEQQYRNTEPDVVINLPDLLLFIEVKDQSGFGSANGDTEAQLRREWRLGEWVAGQNRQVFHLVTLTRRSEKIREALRRDLCDCYEPNRDRIHCLFWEDVYDALNALEQPSDETERRFLDEMLALLRERHFDKPPTVAGQRSYHEYVGEDTANCFLEALAKIFGEEVRTKSEQSVRVVDLDGVRRQQLAEALEILFQAANRAIPNDPMLDLNRILPRFLLNDEQDPHAKDVSDFFYWLLSRAYYDPCLRLFGKNDFSIGFRTSKGDISILTARAGNFEIVLNLLR